MFELLIIVGALGALGYFMRWFLTPLTSSWNDPPATSYKHEVLDPASEKKTPFPSLFDTPSVYISLIAPAYNEEARLPVMMKETMAYLEQRKKDNPKFTYEVIIVDDGSKDRTTPVALTYTTQYGVDKVRVLTLAKNQGKGGAVQQGMLHARGQYLLMVDADGATDIKDLIKVEDRLKQVEREGLGIAVGSRAHLEDEAVATRKWYRNILMYGFHFLVWSLAVRTVRDTQCGFKLFTRDAARVLFFNQRLRRWCFDVELLHMAEALNIPIAEVSVKWDEIPGSKLNLLDSSLKMGRDLVIIRAAYSCGLWKIRDPPTKKTK